MVLAPKKELTPEELHEANIASYWNMQFKNAMIHKAEYTKKWLSYWDAYRGDYFNNKNLPDYKSNLVSNYVFSVIETIRPIMFDNSPKFQAIPRIPEGLDFSNDVQDALVYEWDREHMSKKFIREAVNLLVTGNSILFMPWDSKEKNVKPIFINPFNIFVDPLATCFDDAGFVIYARYFHEELLKKLFPQKADRLVGQTINYSELVMDNNRNARVIEQVLVLEVWIKDHRVTEMLDQTGLPQKEYPNGRVITLAPEQGLVLSDKPNPYIHDKGFPFIQLKDYDLPGKFWGEGEVAQLISPQQYMNELNNAILDNAKATANLPWIIDKNSGIGEGKITSRPGLVIRKNPGTEVRRDPAPNMPNYVVNAIETYKHDIEQISGIFDSIKGNSETGVYTAQGVLALQEAGQARIRLKVKLLEDALADVGKMWVSRIRQFWKDKRFIAVSHSDGQYSLKDLKPESLDFDYEVKITAGSTMPVNRGAMLDLMVRLAQTPMPDGQPLVDREAVVNYLPEEVKSTLLRRMNGRNDQLTQEVQQMSQQMQQYQADDQKTMSTLDSITGALEHLKQEILQLQQKNDKLEKDKAEQDKLQQAEQQAYNQGYSDAEKHLQPNTDYDAESVGEDMTDPNQMMSQFSSQGGQPSSAPDSQGSSPEGLSQQSGVNGVNPTNGLPSDLVQGLSQMTNEELAQLMQHHPELQNLVR